MKFVLIILFAWDGVALPQMTGATYDSLSRCEQTRTEVSRLQTMGLFPPQLTMQWSECR